MLQKYKALGNQSIYDICLMTYGALISADTNLLFKLMADNGFDGVNSYPAAGQVFTWDDTLVFDEAVANFNAANNTNYATQQNAVGNMLSDIDDNSAPGTNVGYPVSGGSGGNSGAGSGSTPTKYDYYLVYNSDIRWSNGGLTFTDPSLKGKTGYAVYAQQLSQFFSCNADQDLHYDSVAGSFTILTPGFQLINTYYLVIFPNKYDTNIL